MELYQKTIMIFPYQFSKNRVFSKIWGHNGPCQTEVTGYCELIIELSATFDAPDHCCHIYIIYLTILFFLLFFFPHHDSTCRSNSHCRFAHDICNCFFCVTYTITT